MSKTGLATNKDIGKIVSFTDSLDGKYITYGILNDVISSINGADVKFPYIREGDYSRWRYARRLTEEEIKELV